MGSSEEELIIGPNLLHRDFMATCCVGICNTASSQAAMLLLPAQKVILANSEDQPGSVMAYPSNMPSYTFVLKFVFHMLELFAAFPCPTSKSSNITKSSSRTDASPHYTDTY